ncbi:MAG: peptide chain release factor N(5)-glutamine methyltransferase, partial [Thermoanaerobaculia bacterium]|nr:peptide chain release factor N(5)-glutamine methyltransferase [Thermoanaerobaculia bacterium]
ERDGTALIDSLLGQCRGLAPETPVLLEVGAGQADRIAAIADRYDLRLQERRRDYAGHERVLSFVVA